MKFVNVNTKGGRIRLVALIGSFMIGFAMSGGRILGGIMTGLIGLAYARGHYLQNVKKVKKKYSFLANDDLFSRYLLLLIAAVLQADKKESQPEYHYIRKSLSEHYKHERVEKYIKYIQEAVDKGTIDHKQVCGAIRKDFDLSSKIELMHLLVGIATIDGVMAKAELSTLKEIAITMRIPFKTYQSIINMFRFRHEGAEQKRTSSYSSKYRLQQAFKILEIDENASVVQIKKAYRKLALKHHPDRVIHLGPDYQKSAKEKFQVISDAYEYIKEKKGFS